ncbi:exodeoxyribonuclease VII small subunit [Rhizosphaericola mali]|uniref:Exodeoxyribonuclease 7 small subunit n=1 Tax=Rhizosphaericola mali TaxID=2545455 RepID=A0A5P2G042_9BACT|nr:exodeoxyribonuclease VII small subunit [Rhizosphaericola mali]QES87489.1 exodeoxyribonuclease VII small subunit [Rhizosphaericola mali]
MENEISYAEAFEELQMIVSDMENGEISIDELSSKVRRASLLIKVCKEKISSTEEDVQQILKELDDKKNIETDY